MRAPCGIAAMLASAILTLSMPCVAWAQNQATLTTTYTAITTAATITDLTSLTASTGRVIAGFVDVSVLCRRNSATCTVQFSSSATTPTVRYFLGAANAAAPALATCSTAVPNALTVLFTGPGNGVTTTRRVYLCVDVSWTTAPLTFQPSIVFQSSNG